jgi:hypothetical protein
MHESGISILLFVIGALLLGSLIKALMRDSKLPYTVNLLLAGMILAGLDRAGWLAAAVQTPYSNRLPLLTLT